MERDRYCFQNAAAIGHDVAIVETQNAKALIGEKCRAARVGAFLISGKMLSAIEFDNEMRGMTDKINDEGSYRDLALKAGAVQAMSAQSRPNSTLRIG